MPTIETEDVHADPHHVDIDQVSHGHHEIEAVNEAIDALSPSIPSDPDLEDLHHNQAALFARSLKLTQPSTSTILSFDINAFTSKCSRVSPAYDPYIDMSIVAQELFVKDEVWTSKEVLFDCLSAYADSIGYKAVKSRDLIRLKSRNPTVKDDDGFYIKLRALHNEKKPAASPKDPAKSVAKARPVWEKEVQIREVSTILPLGIAEGGTKRAAEEELVTCPSTSFAYSLKKLDGLSLTIVGFDEKSLVEKCSRTVIEEDGLERQNPEFDERLEMDLMATELFKQGEVWISRDILYHALSSFGAVFGFKVVKTRNMLCCKRYGSDNGNRNWSQGPWKVECPFSLSLKALHTERRLTENPKDPEKNLAPKCRPIWEREVLIKEANVVHGGGCKPGMERAVAAVKKPPKAVHPNVTVMKHGGLVSLFTKIRDENTGVVEFVQYSKRIMRLLVEETAAVLPALQHTVNTPTNVRYKGQLSIIDTNPERVCLVSVIRAGDALLESFREIFPAARVGKMWIQRDESSLTKEAIHSCTKLPHGVHELEAVVLCDPMLATGGSSLVALNTLVNEYGVKPERIVFANVISCPEGLDVLAKEFPDVRIVTAWVDEGLNEDKFILPGLGDYGDRFFNTVEVPTVAAASMNGHGHTV